MRMCVYNKDTYARFISSFVCIKYLLLHKTVFLRNSVLIIILMLSIVLLSYNSTFQTVVVAKKHRISIISSSGNGQQQQATTTTPPYSDLLRMGRQTSTWNINIPDKWRRFGDSTGCL